MLVDETHHLVEMLAVWPLARMQDVFASKCAETTSFRIGQEKSSAIGSVMAGSGL